MKVVYGTKVNLAISGKKVKGPMLSVGSFYTTDKIPVPFTSEHLKDLVSQFKGLPIAFPDVKKWNAEDTHPVKEFIGLINNAWIEDDWIWGEGEITKDEYLQYVKEQQGVSPQLLAFQEDTNFSYVPTHVMVIPQCVDDGFCPRPQVQGAKLHLVNNAIGENMKEQEYMETIDKLRKENKALRVNLAATAEPFISEIVNGEAFLSVFDGSEIDHFARTAELLKLADDGNLEELIKLRDGIREQVLVKKTPRTPQVDKTSTKPVTNAPKSISTPPAEDPLKELNQLPFRERMKKAVEINGGDTVKTMGFNLDGRVN